MALPIITLIMGLMIAWTTYAALRDNGRENADEARRHKAERLRLKQLVDRKHHK